MNSKILIAEDETAIADAIEIYLKSQQYETIKASNGAVAWDIIQKENIDLAIIDIMMISLSSFCPQNQKILIR